MLSIAPIAGGGAGYYTSQDNYYFLGSMQSRWLGEGAKSLQLEGPVDASRLDELIAGVCPTASAWREWKAVLMCIAAVMT